MSTTEELKTWVSENIESLKAAGVSRICGTWHGEGDDGQFDSVQVEVSSGFPHDYKVPDYLEELIEELCFQQAGSFSVDGSPGAGGELTIDIAAGGKLVYREWHEEIVEHEDKKEEL